MSRTEAVTSGLTQGSRVGNAVLRPDVSARRQCEWAPGRPAHRSRIEPVRPIVVPDPRAIDVESVAMIGPVITEFWVLSKSRQSLQPIDGPQRGCASSVRTDEQHLLIASARSAQVIQEVNVGHVA